MLRVIREVQPRWIVGENVLGLVNWSGGLVFEEVQADLEAQGYEVQAYVLPAAAVNAPHRRDRVWFVAYSNGNSKRSPRESGSIEGSWSNNNDVTDKWGSKTEFNIGSSKFSQTTPNPHSNGQHQRNGIDEINTSEGGQYAQRDTDKSNEHGDAADTSHIRRENALENGELERRRFGESYKRNTWDSFPSVSPVCIGDDGFSDSSYITSISDKRNTMDRNLVTKLCLEEGRLKVDFLTGKIYSLKQRGKEGQEIELYGSDCNGYIVHGIRYNGFKIQLRAHQIVWIAANGLYDKKYLMIDHINRNKKDNRLENLRLVNAKENRENSTEYHGKLTEEQKDSIVWLNKQDAIPIRELAEDYGISKSRVHQIIKEHSGLYGITFSKWRNESIKAAGNAVVPQVVYEIFKAIEKYENKFC